MAYDEGLAERLHELLDERPGVTAKKMFGGLCFMSQGNMLCGIIGATLMARVGPEEHAAALTKPFAKEMDFTGRSMKGFVIVEPEGLDSDEELRDWVALCDAFVSTLPPK
jgi:hypothetical protein